MIMLVKYIALQWDNHQGGSGVPFENVLTIEVNQFEQLHKAYKIAESEVLKCVNFVQFGQASSQGYKIISVELVKPISASEELTTNN